MRTTREVVPHSTRPGWYPRWLTGYLTYVMAAANLVQFALGAMAPALVADLDLSRSRLGLLLSGYYLAAAGLSLVAGRLVDRVGPRCGIALLAVSGAAAFTVVGLARSYPALVSGVVVGAAAAALASPATNLALAALPGRRGVLVGVKQSGVQVGAVVAGVALPAVAIDHGWRAAAFCSAALFVPCLAALRVTPGRAGAGRLPGAGKVPGSVGSPGGAGVGRIRGLPGYAFAMGAGMATLTTYLPLYAHESVGFDVRAAGLLVAVVGFFGVAARIGWSALAERPPATPGRTRAVLLAMAVLAVCAVVLLVAVRVPAALWLAAAVAGSGAVAWNGVAMGAVVRFAAPTRTAAASGRVQAAFFLGLCAGPPVFGVLADSGRYPVGWGWTGLCFAGAAALLYAVRFSRRPLDGTSPK